MRKGTSRPRRQQEGRPAKRNAWAIGARPRPRGRRVRKSSKTVETRAEAANRHPTDSVADRDSGRGAGSGNRPRSIGTGGRERPVANRVGYRSRSLAGRCVHVQRTRLCGRLRGSDQAHSKSKGDRPDRFTGRIASMGRVSPTRIQRLSEILQLIGRVSQTHGSRCHRKVNAGGSRLKQASTGMASESGGGSCNGMDAECQAAGAALSGRRAAQTKQPTSLVNGCLSRANTDIARWSSHLTEFTLRYYARVRMRSASPVVVMTVLPMARRLPGLQPHRRTWMTGLLLLLSALGLEAAERHPKPRGIIGGQAASVEDYPFIVYLQTSSSTFCSGTIVAPSWVLTAAHCVSGVNQSQRPIKIEHGYASRFGFTTRDSKQIVLHPQYSSNRVRFHNDIALVEVSKPFPGSYIAQISTASRAMEHKYASSGMLAQTLGYGHMEGDVHSDGLRSVEVMLFHAESCRRQLDFLHEEQLARDDTICAGATETRSNNGDSGGPLIVNYSRSEGPKWLQVGITSMAAKNAAEIKVTAIYTRVSSYTEWIQKATKQAVVPLSEPAPSELSSSGDQITARLHEAEKQVQTLQGQVQTLQGTVQSLRAERIELRKKLSQLKQLEGQVQPLHVRVDQLLQSASTALQQ